MGRQIVHRLLISFPALLGVLFLCFCLLQVVPADPAMIIAGPDAKAETIAAIRLELGLDRPIPVQFLEYIGRVVRGEPTLTTEHEVRSLGAAAFHRQMLERAAGSIDTIPRELRDLAALTVCVSSQTAALVKQRIHQFREALTELCDADTQGSTVYQLNVQWFPLSVTADEKDVSK